MNKKFYITTAIYYVNSAPHIGHALELIQADVLARYYRLLAVPTLFQTGTDEHGIKNYTTAKELKIQPEQLIEKNTKLFEKLDHELNISYDNFIRTSDQELHWPGVEKFWRKLVEAGDIYKGQYEGFYCVGHESFHPESDLTDGHCPDYPDQELQKVSEETYFFKYSKYISQVTELLEKSKLSVIPSSRKNEILNLLRSNPGDVSFSRPKDKLPWGIPVPGDPEHVIYVWADALVNYLTGIGYGRDEGEFNKWWPADVHVIGKDILRFHAGLWPAMLLSAQLPIPNVVFVHGFVTKNGKKLSKSTGNVIDPFELIKTYGADPVRYYLLREAPATHEVDYSDSKFKSRYNADLASGLGNLISRVATMAAKADLDLPEKPAKPLLDSKYRIAIEDYRFNDALNYIWGKISETDKLISEEKPWELIESNPERAKEVLRNASLQIREIGELLLPLMPATAEKVLELYAGPKVGPVEPLFPRLEKNEAR